MASYTGGSREASRIQALEKERQERRDEIEKKREAIAASSSCFVDDKDKFSSKSETVEDLLKTDTVGLVTHEDFKKRREYMERCAADYRKKQEAKKRDEEAESRKQRLKRANKATLSFADDEEGSDDSDSEDNNSPLVAKRRNAEASKADNATGSPSNLAKKRKIVKNPKADTSFLPDRERELAKKAERERLEQEWTNEQERIKNELVRITYSYWNGSGHRRVMRCKKGMTVGRFLAAVQGEFKELRHVSAESLMYIKEDLIIPPHYSFYDFIVAKARGKSGPLFNFDVVEDIRVVSDANKEKEDAHASKVVERRWYEKNRHIFPASRWEVYDPEKKYDSYTIHGV